MNDDKEIKKLLVKLPDRLVTRWGRVVAEWKDIHRTFALFTQFTNCIVTEADIACDPVTPMGSL